VSNRAFQDGLTTENLQILLSKTPFAAFLKPEVVRCEDGFAELHVAMRQELTQHHGFAHGAVIGCIADSACAWAAGSIAGDVMTAAYSLHLLGPGVGQKLIGRGYVVQNSKTIIVCRSEVFAVRAGKEHLVAIATATISVITRPSNAPVKAKARPDGMLDQPDDRPIDLD
jgi:uncharacterized protein (TIGR00369 family)